MAHFYSTVTSKGTTHTKCGHKKRGMSSSTNGWDLGVDVDMHYDAEKDRDVATISVTHGSSGHGTAMRLGEFVKDGDSIKKIV